MKHEYLQLETVLNEILFIQYYVITFQRIFLLNQNKMK